MGSCILVMSLYFLTGWRGKQDPIWVNELQGVQWTSFRGLIALLQKFPDPVWVTLVPTFLLSIWSDHPGFISVTGVT